MVNERAWREGPTLPDRPDKSAPNFDDLDLSANPGPRVCGFRGVGVRVVEGTSTPRILNSDVMLDPEIWKIVFEVYARHPTSAFTLAFQLIAIKQSLQHGQKGIPNAIAGLDLAIESLYPHTHFHKMGHKFYHRTIEGNLKPEQEEKLRQFGVKL